MAGSVSDLSAYRMRVATRDRVEGQRLPLALVVHLGAVELIVGSPLDEGAFELWLEPEQALELAEDLRRTALAARGTVLR